MATPNYTIALVANPIGVGAATRGKCLVLADDGLSYLVATLANRGTKKCSGISLGDAPVNGAVVMQSVGDCPSATTGLAAGDAGLLRVDDDGNLERLETPVTGDDVVGWVEADGTAHLLFGVGLTPAALFGDPVDNILKIYASSVQNLSSAYVNVKSSVNRYNTTNSNQATAGTIATVTGRAYLVTVTMMVKNASGSVRGFLPRTGLFANVGGVLSLEGTLIGDDEANDQKSDPLRFTLDVSGTSIRKRVTGIAATNLDWTDETRVQEAIAV